MLKYINSTSIIRPRWVAHFHQTRNILTKHMNFRSPELTPSTNIETRTKSDSDPCTYFKQQVKDCSGTPKICSFNSRALLACQYSSFPSSPSSPSSTTPLSLEKTRFSQNTGAPPIIRQRILALEKEKEMEKRKVLGREEKMEMMDQSTKRLKLLFLRFFLWLSGFGIVQWVLGFRLVTSTVGDGEVRMMGKEGCGGCGDC